MNLIKSIITILLVATWIVACGPKAIQTTTSKPTSVPSFETVDIPSEVTLDTFLSQEKTLFGLPAKHPQRRELRDVLIKYHLEVFDTLQKEEAEKKLEEFRLALSLHDPSDFRPGHVCEAMVPMAQWVTANFEPQGKEALVLAGLMFLSLAIPDDPTYAQRYQELWEWSESVRETIEDPVERYRSISQMYMAMIQMLPHEQVVDRFALVLAKRQQAVIQLLHALEKEAENVSPILFQTLLSQGGIGKEIVHAYFLAGRLPDALQKMKTLNILDGVNEELVSLLQEIENKENLADNYYILAGLLGPDDPIAGMRACMLARAVRPEDPKNSLCIGRFFSRMERQESAIEFYADAVAVQPDETVLINAMDMTRVALYEFHLKENANGMELAVQRAEQIVETATKLENASSELRLSASSLMDVSGEIDYNDGRIPDARRHFSLALKLWPTNPTPLLKLAEIEYFQGQYDTAINMLNNALNSPTPIGGDFAEYWRAMILELRGNCHRAQEKKQDATKDYQDALATWDTADYPQKQAPVIAIHRGILNERLGRSEQAVTAFKEAIRMDPERRASYAEIISHLVINRQLEEAKQFYRLAFNQDQIEAMWKVYYSLWVEGLSLIQSGESYDLARGYLEQSDGNNWQDHLAQYFIGKIDATALRSKAKSKGQQVEADYYEALKLIGQDDFKTAITLLKQVTASDLLGFFEYRMAKDLLVQQ